MNWKPRFALLALVLLFPLLAACGGIPAGGAAAQEQPTPTPLPPDPALERPTYTVERGPIDRVLTVNGRVTPVDLTRISFKRDGRVETVHFKRGDVVQAGDLIAELQQDDEIDALREAEDTLVQAQRDLESAQKEQQKKIEQAQLALEQAQEDLALVMPGGLNDPIRQAQQELEEAQRAARQTGDTGSEGKTDAEYALLQAAERLQDQQKAREDAFWDNDWAQKYGTNPDNPYSEDPVTGKKTPNKLTDEEIEAYADALVEADRALRDAERGIVDAQRALDKAREAEIVGNTEADEKVREAQRKLDSLVNGRGNRDLIEAQRNVEQAQLALEEAQAGTFNSQIKAVETAQRNLEKAQKKVEDGRIIATQNGEVLEIAISEGDNVTAFEPVVEIADPTNLEVAAELGAEQMRQLAEGQPAEITLLSRPDVILPAIIRQMPAPYGSGGSGAVESQDRTTRFKLMDLKGQAIEAGVTIVKINIVLEHKDDVLWLPPDAVRSFEGRRFVVVREGERERRVTVRTGIETEEMIEILEGVEEGDVIVGQ
jgi:multidrug efflux pump subunit AcrA (membrane-fusion protein)